MSAPPPLPRWFAGRAVRLASLIVEAALETHGHDGLAALLGEAALGSALHALLGLSRATPLDDLLPPLELDLAREEARLGLRLDARERALRFADGRVFPVFVIEDERVIRLHAPRRPVADAPRYLGAALMVARGARSPLLDALEPLSPPTASRARVSLALLAALLAGPVPQADLLRLALGSLDGKPFGVSLVLYDELIAALERLLHGPGRKRSCRTAPLLALHDAVARCLTRAPPLELDRFARRELRHTSDLSRGDLTSPPGRPRPLPRRRPRQIERGLSYVPASWPPSPSAQQRELFAP